VAPLKPLPKICTLVPPAAVPLLGSTALTTGGDVADAGIDPPIAAVPASSAGKTIREISLLIAADRSPAPASAAAPLRMDRWPNLGG
jgi:hypothetical protein